ncbi:MAG: DNA-3-methyladenine glycosylase 2 family protein, partial [Ilumatobacteraceae bacterium]
DALPVGDFHVKNTVAWALTGAPRGSDEQMLITLAPYTGYRWQVVRLLEKHGVGAPKFAPKRRILDISRL